MNNKGFAITTILFGTLILFLMLLLSMLGILSTYKERLTLLIDSNNGARDIINGNVDKKWLCGDINMDGKVDYHDAEALSSYFQGNYNLSDDIVVNNLDFDNNGEVNEEDAVYLLLYTSLGSDTYPLNCPNS